MLRALVLSGGIAVAITETLSPLHWLRREPLALAWTLVTTMAAVWLWWRRKRLPGLSIGPIEAAIGLAIAAIAGLVGTAATLSPPNSADAMAYHMPRVVYWAQAGSVAFFPTPYFNQISLQPLAEYLMLQTYVLSGGDHFINLIAFGAFLGSIVGVSALAGRLGLGSRGQAYAALFCATLPNGILQASGAKNDSLVGLWLVCLVYFTLRRNAPFAGMALGLALATKATAYLFAPPMVAAAMLCGPQDWRLWPPRAMLRMAGCLAGGALIINAPQYLRNLQLSGLPLGYDSAQGDGALRWPNDHPGWQSTVSNALRHASEQLGARSPGWNQAVFHSVVRVEGWMGIDPQDLANTFRGAVYAPPRNARNHEADANNRWHLLLLAVALAFAAATRRSLWVMYGVGLVAAFLLFCFYLKWQPFMARMELPLFVMGAPLAACLLEALRPNIVTIGLCLLLVNNTRAALFDNWTRPLEGPRSVFVTSRQDAYFADMTQWDNRASYLAAVEVTARSGCRTVGIDISRNQLEYPFQALLRLRDPQVQFEHVGVENASARYYPAKAEQPCVVFCPDCAGWADKVARYGSTGETIAIGHFLLFVRR